MLWTDAPLVAGGPLPRLLMQLSQGRFSGLSFGGLDCSTGPCFVPDLISAVGPSGREQFRQIGSVANAPTPPAAIPAPGAALLLGEGLLGVLGARRARA